MAGEVVLIDDFSEPFLHHGGVDVVVIDPVFVTGVVGRVDVDALDFPGIGGQQGLEGDEVVAVDDEVVVEGEFSGEALLFAGDELVVLDGKVVVLDEGFAFEVEGSHCESGVYEFSQSQTRRFQGR